MNKIKYKDCIGTTTNGERVVNYTDGQTLSKKDKEMLIANSMKAVRDGESKKAFLKNTKFIIDGMIENNYNLEEENEKLKQMWEEFKNTVAYDDGESTETYGEMCSDVINELEQKYKLGE